MATLHLRWNSRIKESLTVIPCELLSLIFNHNPESPFLPTTPAHLLLPAKLNRNKRIKEPSTAMSYDPLNLDRNRENPFLSTTPNSPDRNKNIKEPLTAISCEPLNLKINKK